MPTFAVVGANLAGGRAAEALRANGFDGRIVLVGAEEHPPSKRPPLSKARGGHGMAMSLQTQEPEDLVSLERGEIDRRVFSDPGIFEQEMELIFGRAWQFMCHETQIPRAGDFFEAPIARDNVLVVRQKDRSIKGLLNTCAHRGNAVCRAEEGNVKNFMCTYHGWTYDLSGKLMGVPASTTSIAATST